MKIPTHCPICKKELKFSGNFPIRFECPYCVHNQKVELYYGNVSDGNINYFCIKIPFRNGYVISLSFPNQNSNTIYFINQTRSVDSIMTKICDAPTDFDPDQSYHYLLRIKKLMAFT